jgi:Tfp pilus assembly PilM family ATPase
MTMYEGFQYFANIKTERGILGMYERLVDHHGYNEHDVKYYLYNFKGEAANVEDRPDQKIELIKSSLEDTSSESSLKDLQMKLNTIQKANFNVNDSDSELLQRRNAEYDNLINEVSRMVEFFKSRKYGTFVDNIYLFGGGAYLSNFTEIIEETLGIPCEVLPAESFSNIIDKENFELMVPAIGACLGGRS